MGKKKTEGKDDKFSIYPILALENIVLTPMIPQPVKIDREEQRDYINKCYSNHNEVFFATVDHQENTGEEEEHIKKLGLLCVIDRVLQMPGAPSLAFVRPVCRANFEGMVYSPAYPMAKVSLLKNVETPKRKREEFPLLMDRVDSLFKMVMNFIAEPEKVTAEKLVQENSNTPVEHLYSIIHVAPFSWEEKYRLIESNTFNQLLESTILMLDEFEQKIKIQASIHERTHQELSQQQKEAFLRMHLKMIKDELGESEEKDEISDLMSRSSKKIWTKEARENFEKEVQKLKRLNINNPEYSIQLSYLETLLELPWNNYNHKKLSLDKVEEVLNRDHYGLEKVKERILEYMAVLKLRNDMKAPILCLYGPPGVGKTSIGKSVAEAVGREYARISLGGMHDEAEIRGHRKTYIGAMPGRFLHTLSKLKYGNPLILLDEIDKVGKDYKGDPSSALLEALDPEQNNTFHDNFIDFPYDLSRVLFIATANDLSSIPGPLRDRMEIIEMAGYTLNEKREIALRHLVDKVLQENGLKKGEVNFLPSTIDFIIKNYTNEKGVRQLEKALGRITRKLALMKVRTKKVPKEITDQQVNEFLGKKDTYLNNVGFH
ncbi:MAG: AAA family ATPase [Muribaculaceae bacterium]|nr:AAA family ATPase [Muribaculaceae bacterium]